MPAQTLEAVNWALTQEVTDMYGTTPVTKDTHILLVDKVREYFNTNVIIYSTFSYDDLTPFFN